MNVTVNPIKAKLSNQQVLVTWEQPTDQVSATGPVSSYHLELKPADSNEWQEIFEEFVVDVPQFILNNDKLKEYVNYEVRVIAENDAGKSNPSSVSNQFILGKYLK